MSKWTDQRGNEVDPYAPKGKPSRFPRYFIVRGSGEFPLDMLRYDKAWALTGIGEPNDFSQSERDVVCASNEGHPLVPTEGRWESFGWVVVDREVSKQDIQSLVGGMGMTHSDIFEEVM